MPYELQWGCENYTRYVPVVERKGIAGGQGVPFYGTETWTDYSVIQRRWWRGSDSNTEKRGHNW